MVKIFILLKTYILIAIVVLQTGLAYTQSIQQTEVYADSLCSVGSFKNALNEYRRAYFFATSDSNKCSLARKIADTYVFKKNYQLAKTFCDSIGHYSTSDSISNEAYLKKMTCLILEKQYGDAFVGLEKVNVSNYQYLEKQKHFLKGLACLGLNDFDNAYEFFSKIIADKDSTLKVDICHLIDKTKKYAQHYPVVAAGMSALVPGLGQIYSGHYFDGFNSVFLLAGLSCIGYFLQPLSILVLPMVARYYMGGVLHAYRFADEKKNEHQLECSNNIISQLKGDNLFLRDFYNRKYQSDFSKYTFDSDKELSLLISTFFLSYKRLISSQDVDACIFTPSCSVYMMQTIKKNGILAGFLDGTDRLLRCHGLADHTHYKICITTDKLEDEP